MKIENYLEQKQAVRDIHLPNKERMWEQIMLQQVRRSQFKSQVLKWAAAILVFGLVMGALVRHEMVVQEQITSLSQINKDLATREQHYQQLVTDKWTQFTQMSGAESPIEPMLFDELKQLDTLYQSGLKEIIETGCDERAVVLLLNIYEKRLRIIEQLICEKRKQKNYENKIHEYDI
jgi:hypothetical protein